MCELSLHFVFSFFLAHLPEASEIDVKVGCCAEPEVCGAPQRRVVL